MTPPRSAFGASPSRGRAQRTGKAGSAGAAWLSRAGLALVLALSHGPMWAGDGRTPLPVIERATAGAACVAPSEVMRRSHMDFLKHQRDDTVRGGVRGARYSLKACIDCHASAQTASVAKADTNFCISCHQYAAVSIDCFECHSTQPAGKGHAVTAGVKP